MLKITKIPLTFVKQKNKIRFDVHRFIYRKKSLPGPPKPPLASTNKNQTKWYMSSQYVLSWWIRVITKLPNSEQSYKGKVKTHKYINRQNQSTTGKLWKP